MKMMISVKETGALLLVATGLLSGVAARSCKPCGSKDRILVLFRSDDFNSEANQFCSSFLDLPASTVDITVTPTVVSTATETNRVTEVLTTIDATSTVTTTVTAVPNVVGLRRRDVDYPSWLPTKYLPERVSSACHCLSVPLAVTTRTVSDAAITVTTTATVTDTTTSTTHTTATATTTAVVPPAPSQVQRRGLIQVLRKSTGGSVGYVYMSSGPAITTDPSLAVIFRFNVTTGITTSSGIRFEPEGYSGVAMGFNVPINQKLRDYYGTLVTKNPTSHGSIPVNDGVNNFASDIFTLDATTNTIGWDWIESDGSHSPLDMYRVGGRMYPVGNVAYFNAAFGSISASSRYEITFKVIFI